MSRVLNGMNFVDVFRGDPERFTFVKLAPEKGFSSRSTTHDFASTDVTKDDSPGFTPPRRKSRVFCKHRLFLSVFQHLEGELHAKSSASLLALMQPVQTLLLRAGNASPLEAW